MERRLSKRRQSLIRTGIYSFMTLAVIVIVTLLVFVVLGYQFNQKDGKIEQGGLLQYASVPTGAAITLDGNILGPRTNSKSNVAVGSHSVSFDRSGYRTWKKTISISAGEIGWLSYARLIPSTITPQSVRTFTTLAGAVASPDHNFMLLHESSDQPAFTLVNIQGDTPQYSSVTLPESAYTQPAEGKTQSFTIDSWSENEAAIIVRHTFNDGEVEWLLLNRNNPSQSVNINASYGIAPTKVVFAGQGDRLLFVQSDDAVRRINLDEQTLSRPLASKVANFTVYDDKTIAYSTLPDDKQQRSVGYAAVDVADPVKLNTFPADNQPLYITMSTYFSERYVATLYGQTLTVKAGSLPTKSDKGTLKTVATETVPSGATNLSLEHSSRFAVMQLSDGYATYDIELNKYDKTTWSVAPNSPRPLMWLDSYIVWSGGGGMLRIYDFDGANQQNIMPISEDFSVSISPNNKYIYGVLKTDKGFEFRRAQLIL